MFRVSCRSQGQRRCLVPRFDEPFDSLFRHREEDQQSKSASPRKINTDSRATRSGIRVSLNQASSQWYILMYLSSLAMFTPWTSFSQSEPMYKRDRIDVCKLMPDGERRFSSLIEASDQPVRHPPSANFERDHHALLLVISRRSHAVGSLCSSDGKGYIILPTLDCA